MVADFASALVAVSRGGCTLAGNCLSKPSWHSRVHPVGRCALQCKPWWTHHR